MNWYAVMRSVLEVDSRQYLNYSVAFAFPLRPFIVTKLDAVIQLGVPFNLMDRTLSAIVGW